MGATVALFDSPKSLDEIGATEELAQFVGAGLLIHLFLAPLYLLFFSRWNLSYAHDLHAGLAAHGVGQIILTHPWFSLCYLAISLIIAQLFGMAAGFLSLRQTIRKFLSRRLRIRFVMDRPLVFDFFYQGEFSGITFVELEMKEHAGFYTGQLAGFALVRDVEPHKPVYMQKVLYRAEERQQYTPIAADGVWFDLADALSVRLVRVPQEAVIEHLTAKTSDRTVIGDEID